MKNQKSIKNQHDVLRSVWNRWLQKRMRSSDATCCAILATNTWFFSLRETPPSNMPSRSPKTWYLTHYHVPIRLPKTAHLSMMASKFCSSSNRSKNGQKHLKSTISVITKKSVISRLPVIDFHSRGCVAVS